MNETLLTIVVVLGFTALMSFFVYRQKNSFWEGTLTDKKKSTSTDEDGFSTDTYKLIFTTTQNKKIKVRVNQKMFNEAEIGKKYTKNKGDLLPKIQESVQNQGNLS